MSEIEFKDDDVRYLRWLSENPRGYVLTTSKAKPAHYMALHTAGCRLIKKYTISQSGDAFTGNGYIKVCAADPRDLLSWITRNGGNGFSKECSKCNPCVPTSEPIFHEVVIDTFERGLARSLRNAAARRERLKSAEKKPKVIFVISKAFVRNYDVVAEVLDRANGKCERCKKSAPFNRAKDGTPYLEVHHKIQLAKGGLDSVENAIALCPNCHRQEHHG